MAGVYILPISTPNPPAVGDVFGTLATHTPPSGDDWWKNNIFISEYTFRLYGGSENGNDQIAKDWKAAQTAYAQESNLYFDINVEHDIDGYVLEGTAKVISEP